MRGQRQQQQQANPSSPLARPNDQACTGFDGNLRSSRSEQLPITPHPTPRRFDCNLGNPILLCVCYPSGKKKTSIMPWQSMASLGVIVAMFNVVPALNTGVQYLGYGKAKELGLTSNEWNYRMSKRDEAYQQHAARVRAEMDKLRVQKA